MFYACSMFIPWIEYHDASCCKGNMNNDDKMYYFLYNQDINGNNNPNLQIKYWIWLHGILNDGDHRHHDSNMKNMFLTLIMMAVSVYDRRYVVN
ncbi:hypothetical protein KFK09_022885 [Dendrobium nobile]|uniref:Uncharacterized protein n=1 Tax=Dendrobium nobile TaxID=94219 RepID=A0A8T3AR44_DENNO|nr:hypothetical protein KFK09_022885 [Dendrobium nobile]